MARRLARECELSDVRGWLDYAQNAKGLNDPAAFVVRQLLDSEPAPSESATRRASDWRNNRAIRHERYASEGVMT